MTAEEAHGYWKPGVDWPLIRRLLLKAERGELPRPAKPAPAAAQAPTKKKPALERARRLLARKG